MVFMVVLIWSAGTLDRVNNISATIQDQSVTIMWEAPFTLDLTGVDPDITYCVDVMDSLRNTLYSQCGIDTTSVTIPLDADLMCQASAYTITPVNFAGNGTRLSMDVYGNKYSTIPDNYINNDYYYYKGEIFHGMKKMYG